MKLRDYKEPVPITTSLKRIAKGIGIIIVVLFVLGVSGLVSKVIIPALVLLVVLIGLILVAPIRLIREGIEQNRRDRLIKEDIERNRRRWNRQR